jgi:hypothetical protein
MPYPEKGRPRVAEPGDRLNAQVTATVTKTSVTRRDDSRRVPLARASLFAPDGVRRTRWAITYLCPVCGFGHLGRSREAWAGVIRRSACGRLILVVVARTYRGHSGSGAAA